MTLDELHQELNEGDAAKRELKQLQDRHREVVEWAKQEHAAFEDGAGTCDPIRLSILSHVLDLLEPPQPKTAIDIIGECLDDEGADARHIYEALRDEGLLKD